MRYYLSLGANLGEREQTIRRAIQCIEQQIGPVLRCSSFYYSEPWGFTSENPFCNLCCEVETPLAPMAMLRATQAIERALGRTQKSTITNHHSSITIYSDRRIDIDLIRAFETDGKEIHYDHPDLHIPHLLWEQRDFVRIPLAEILG